MLYDPKWEAPTKADPFSLDSLISWLEKQPADREYCFYESGQCLLAQWLRDTSTTFGLAGKNSYSYVVDGVFIDVRGLSGIVATRPWVLGAALSRARKAAGQWSIVHQHSRIADGIPSESNQRQSRYGCEDASRKTIYRRNGVASRRGKRGLACNV